MKLLFVRNARAASSENALGVSVGLLAGGGAAVGIVNKPEGKAVGAENVGKSAGAIGTE